MEAYNELIGIIALAMGASWASGINLYATILALGVASTTGSIELPENLQILSNPMVIGAAGLMYFIEFFADKIPGVDTLWDSVHTFIRIPGGALIASGLVGGDAGMALEIASGIMGGGMAAVTHATKAGSRVLINTSPEPVTNWTASILEDIAVFTGLWAAVNHPYVFVAFLILFILLLIWLLPKLWGGIKKVFKFIFNKKENENETIIQNHSDLEYWYNLKEKGIISSSEFETKKASLLEN